MKKFSKILSLLLALTMLFALAACGGGDDAKTEDKTAEKEESVTKDIQGTENNNTALTTPIEEADPADDKYKVLNIGWHNSSFGDISPFGVSGSQKINYLQSIYETLIVQTEVGQPVEEMQLVCAKSMEKTAENTYVFELYDYITDTAGNNITAEDVAWCFTTAKENGNLTNAAVFEKATVLDKYKVEIKVIDDVALGQTESLFNNVVIVSKAAYEANDGMTTTVVATGPYIMKDMVAGSTMTLVKNENYWQTDASARSPYSKQNADEIHYQVIAENNQMVIALQSGQIAASTSTKAALVSSFVDGEGKALDGFIVELNPSTKAWTILFNGSEGNSPLANNQALRQAIAYAINPDDFIKVGQKGVANYVYDMASQNCADALDKWKDEDYYNYDVDKAKAKLAEAGYEPGELTLRVLGANNDSDKLISQLIQANLAEIGINCELLSYDTALYNTYKKEPNQWDIITDKPMGDYVVTVWNSELDNRTSGTGGTKNFFFDDKLQELLEIAGTPATHTEENIDAAHDYITEMAYLYTFSSADDFIVANGSILKSVGYLNYGSHNLLPGACEFSDEYLATLD